MEEKAREELAKRSRVYADFPCFSEKKLVDQCYNKTGYDINACLIPITNYKTCKNFWSVVEKLRKFQNVQPARPDAEERDRIRKYYQKHRKLPKFPLEDNPS